MDKFKLSVILVIGLLLGFSAYAQSQNNAIENLNVQNNFTESFIGGEKINSSVLFDNSKNYPLRLSHVIKVEDVKNISDGSAFDVFVNVTDEGESECSYNSGASSNGYLEYVCYETHDVGADSQNVYSNTTLDSNLKLSPGEYKFSINHYTSAGNIVNRYGFNESLKFGDFEIEMEDNLTSNNGSLTHYSDLVFSNPENYQFEGAFDLSSDLVNQTSLNISYSYNGYSSWDDYDISLYRWDNGWEQVSSTDDRESGELRKQSLNLKGGSNVLYGIFVREIEESSGGGGGGGSSYSVSRTSISDDSVSYYVRNPDEGINTVEIDSTNESVDEGVSLNRVDLDLSNYVSRFSIESKSIERPEEALDRDYFEPIGYSELNYGYLDESDVDGANYYYNVSNELFRFTDNVVVNRFNGTEWTALETSVEEEYSEKTLFRADSPGLSIYEVGLLKPNTSVSQVNFSEEVEGNQTVTVTVSNEGRGIGRENVSLKAGNYTESKILKVEGSSSDKVEFTFALAEGNYSLEVNGRDRGQFSVLEAETGEVEGPKRGIDHSDLIIGLIITALGLALLILLIQYHGLVPSYFSEDESEEKPVEVKETESKEQGDGTKVQKFEEFDEVVDILVEKTQSVDEAKELIEEVLGEASEEDESMEELMMDVIEDKSQLEELREALQEKE
jgi:hypothetical protein